MQIILSYFVENKKYLHKIHLLYVSACIFIYLFMIKVKTGQLIFLNKTNIKFDKILLFLVDPFQTSKLSEICCHK